MVAVATQVLHQQDFKASSQVEVTLQTTNVIHVNVDNICVLRVRCEKGTQVRFANAHEEEEILHVVD